MDLLFSWILLEMPRRARMDVKVFIEMIKDYFNGSFVIVLNLKTIY